jgi:hypothetical protein
LPISDSLLHERFTIVNPYLFVRNSAFGAPPSSVEQCAIYAWLTAMSVSYSSGYVQGPANDPVDYVVRELRAQLGDDNVFTTYARQTLSR